MPIDKLRVDLTKKTSSFKIVGRPEVLSRTVEGNWATTFKGKGLEFTGYRQYTFSDDASMIDWRASLRSKDILLREFEEFKNFKVLFALDTSDSMLFTSTGDKFKAEFAAEILFVISQAAMMSGDAIGLAMFNAGVISYLVPSFGAGMRSMFEKELTNKKYYGGVRDFKKSLLQLHSMLEDSAIIMIFSDFLDSSTDWTRYISSLSARHQVFGVMIVDERDLKLPAGDGQFFLKDPLTGKTMYVDNHQFAEEYEKVSAKHVEHIRNVFKRVKGDCLILKNGLDPTDELKKFFNRQRRLVS